MIDHRADDRTDFGDNRGAFGGKRGLHLHRFEHDQRRAVVNLLALFNENFQHLPWHRRNDFVSGETVSAAAA